MIKTWDQFTAEDQQKLEAYWDSNLVGKRIAEHASDDGRGDLDRDYAVWLTQLEIVCQRSKGVSFLDLADFDWRDQHENGVQPREALREALAAEGLL